jgi:hypothetical protein
MSWLRPNSERPNARQERQKNDTWFGQLGPAPLQIKKNGIDFDRDNCVECHLPLGCGKSGSHLDWYILQRELALGAPKLILANAFRPARHRDSKAQRSGN